MKSPQTIESTKFKYLEEKDSQDPEHIKEVERAWGELAEKRYADIVSGKVKTISLEEMLKRVRG